MKRIIRCKSGCAVISVLLCFLAGCAPQMVTDDLALQNNEGIVLLTASCDERIKSFSTSDIKLAPGAWEIQTGEAFIEHCPTEPEIRSFSMPSGDHYIRRVAAVLGRRVGIQLIDANVAITFTVAPGAITYIGDIRLDVISFKLDSELTFTTGFTVTDSEGQLLPEARKAYPTLFQNYRYLKNIAQAHKP